MMGWRVSLLFVVTFLAAGCGGDDSRQEIYGKITLDGQPVEKGRITFTPTKETKGPVVGAEFFDGEYEIGSGEGPIVGKYIVQISSPKQTDKKVVVIPGEDPGYEMIETIPRNYNQRSELTVEVVEGSNNKDFSLTSPGSS